MLQLHESAFVVGSLPPSTRLGESMMDKLFGGREAALAALSDFATQRAAGELHVAKELRRLVPSSRTLHLHGVLRSDPMRLITIKGAAPSNRLLSEVSNERSPNTEGEDELLRRALDTIATSSAFLALIDDIDFRAACLVTMPALLFPEGAAANLLGRLFYAKVDRASASGMEFFCMNEMVIDTSPKLTTHPHPHPHYHHHHHHHPHPHPRPQP